MTATTYLTFLAVFILAPLLPLQAAELKLAALFSDHMVVQRDKPVPVWGWADPSEQVTVSFAGQQKSAAAGADGKWIVRLDALTANAEGRELLVQSSTGGRQLKIRDVLVGEVWLGSGQSNMAMGVKAARDAKVEMAAAKLPLIRMFTEASTTEDLPQADGKGQWAVCSPETVGTFSATLFFFGREAHRALQVPVGLIHSSVGGTSIEKWIAVEAQVGVPELKSALGPIDQKTPSLEEFKAKFEMDTARWDALVIKAKAEGQPPPKKPLSIMKNPEENRKRNGGPGGLFNGKIAPLIPYALRGVLWYQGEANTNAGKGQRYQVQLPLLVNDWRERWGETLPFAWVQLPNCKREAGDDWMLVREAQLKTLRLPNTGMAITVDIGDSDDIHPKNKQDVGRRLAYWALGEVYAQKVAATCGPLPAGHEVRGAEIVIRFTHTEGGLQAKDSALKGFVIAGADRQWQPATARIDGDTVVLSSPQVKQPVAARYAWAADPECNLFNGAGLPASPFRTDD